jgi:polyhydroxyalkanoate synthesis repressor PhaR
MAEETLIVKKYGNRRLYDTEASSYITLDDLARLIRSGRDVRVVDAKSGQDLTKTVLLQIISEQEKAQDLLPVSFLKKMIQIGDSSVRDALQRYLSVSLETFLSAQKDFEERYRNIAGNFFNPLMWMMPGAPGAPGTTPPGGEQIAPPQEPAAPNEPAPNEPAPNEEAQPSDETTSDDPATQQQIKALRAQVEQIQAMLTKLDK